MCVIMWCETDKRRPTDEMLEKAWDINHHGGGLAWREGDEVVWKKGLEYEELNHLCRTVPAPYVVHFRRASVNGGGLSQLLTHPFPVDKNTTLALEGRTKGSVLFHNGDWKGWDEAARYAAMTAKVQIPRGKWSDSRALAWLCSIYGIGFMEFLPEQRGVVFGPKDIDVFSGPGWYKVNDIWCSKDEFVHKGRTLIQQQKVCLFQNCFRTDNLDSNTRCPAHPKLYQVTDNNGNGSKEVAQTNRSPFPEKPFISLSMAERLHKDAKISKNLLKQITKAWDRLKSGNEKQVLKGKASLRQATDLILDRWGQHKSGERSAQSVNS